MWTNDEVSKARQLKFQPAKISSQFYLHHSLAFHKIGIKLIFLGGFWGGNIFYHQHICISEVPTLSKNLKLFDLFISQRVRFLFASGQECGRVLHKTKWVLHFFCLLYSFLSEVFCLAEIDHCKSEGTISSAAGFLV